MVVATPRQTGPVKWALPRGSAGGLLPTARNSREAARVAQGQEKVRHRRKASRCECGRRMPRARARSPPPLATPSRTAAGGAGQASKRKNARSKQERVCLEYV